MLIYYVLDQQNLFNSNETRIFFKNGPFLINIV